MIPSSLTASAPPPAGTPKKPLELDHLSWSAIATYLACPAKFRFRYLDQAPAEFTPSALAFGGALHSVFASVHQARLEGREIPTETDLLEAYTQGWLQETANRPDVQFGRDETPETLTEQARRMIAAYRTHALEHAQESQVLAIEEPERFRLLRSVPPLEMRLDLLERQGEALVITDFKTAGLAWNEEKVREHRPQLRLYALGCRGLLRELGAQRVVLRFVVVTKGKHPKVQVLEPKATQEDVARLKRLVADVWSAVQAGIFVQREGWPCGQCPFKARCLGGHAG
jgi:hypothetical protein